MWQRHPKRLALWVGVVVLLFALGLAAAFWRAVRRSVLYDKPEWLQRYIDQLDEPGFYVAIGLGFVIVIIWAVLRYIQGPR